jgi:hypothetical protein
MASAFLLAHLAVWLWSGFNVVGCFVQCKAQFDLGQYTIDVDGARYRSWAWKFLNPLCWFFFAGIPVSILFIKRLTHLEPETKVLFIVFILSLLAFDMLYLARGEGERSAMYILPFVVLPAAHFLEQASRSTRSTGPLAATAGFLVFQCWLAESWLYTYW